MAGRNEGETTLGGPVYGFAGLGRPGPKTPGIMGARRLFGSGMVAGGAIVGGTAEPAILS